MDPKPIELTINVCVTPPESCRTWLRDALTGNDAEMYLYDLLCHWFFRYVPPTVVSFDLDVNVTVAGQ